MTRRALRILAPAAAMLAIATTMAAPEQAPAFMPLDLVRPGQIGVGRTVFAGSEIQEFRAHVLGVLHNIVGPGRALILARLEGGPLAETGVIQGMSGSPVYIDGRLVGAVSFSLGSFPKDALAGITPIGEMTAALSAPPARATTPELQLTWPAEPERALAALRRVLSGRSTDATPRDVRVEGPAALMDFVPTLRPIGAAFTWAGFDAQIERDVRATLGARGDATPAPRQADAPRGPLRPGDPVGIALIRGDYELGATGTVTHVDGTRVLAFGHSFLNLGRTRLPMTRAQVYTVLPSLDSSMKIAALGPVIGTLTHDRVVGVGGAMGASPAEAAVSVTIVAPGVSAVTHRFHVAHDQSLTPLFTFVGVLNALQAAGRQMGAMTVSASGTVSFGGGDVVRVADRFSGEAAVSAAASVATAAVGIAATNDFRPALAERVDLSFTLSDQVERATIERAWLDTTHVRAGGTHTLSVLLRDYRGDTQTVAMPIQIPAQAKGAMSLHVSDAASLVALEERELRPASPANWPALLARMNTARPGDRIYVRLLVDRVGTVVGGDTLPGLPPSVRSVFDTDKGRAASSISRAVMGAWDHPLGRVVRGSRELAITVETRSP